MSSINLPILIVDYGMGNIGSIKNMFRHIGVNVEVVNKPEQLEEAAGIILPGVGHFDRAMKSLRMSGIADALTEVVSKNSVPVLGICLGMQLMCKSSEEGNENGLGFIDASVRRFSFAEDSNLKVPHMGWGEVVPQIKSTILGDGISTLPRYYFVHSYFVECANRLDVIGTTKYGIEFASAFKRGRITGLQFHPEKSHRYGMQLFKNFVQDLE